LSGGDPPLNAQGRLQCERTRDALRDVAFGICLTSPMRRCIETREIVAPGVAYRAHEALREISFGDWEGRTIDELAAERPHDVARRREDPVNFRPSGGESFADVAVRITPLVESIAAHETGVLVVAHRGTLGVLERLLRGMPLDARDVAPMEPGEYRRVR
jgi:probable phosphoglycerate mutase